MKGYHVTTDKKLKRYIQSGVILPPVRFWTTEYSAKKWMKKTGRNILLILNIEKAYPLPIKGGAMWTDSLVRKWKCQ